MRWTFDNRQQARQIGGISETLFLVQTLINANKVHNSSKLVSNNLLQGKLAEEYMIDNWTRDKVSYTIRKHVLRIEDDILKN